MHTQFVADCVFPHTDNLLITGSGDGTTALWDIETASMIQVSFNFEPRLNATQKHRPLQRCISGVRYRGARIRK